MDTTIKQYKSVWRIFTWLLLVMLHNMYQVQSCLIKCQSQGLKLETPGIVAAQQYQYLDFWWACSIWSVWFNYYLSHVHLFFSIRTHLLENWGSKYFKTVSFPIVSRILLLHSLFFHKNSLENWGSKCQKPKNFKENFAGWNFAGWNSAADKKLKNCRASIKIHDTLRSPISCDFSVKNASKSIPA